MQDGGEGAPDAVGIGTIASTPRDVADAVLDRLRAGHGKVMVFCDAKGTVFVQPLALAGAVAVDAIVSIYSDAIRAEDLIDDLAAAFKLRLAWMGILI